MTFKACIVFVCWAVLREDQSTPHHWGVVSPFKISTASTLLLCGKDSTVYSDCQVVETTLFEEQQFCGVVLYSRKVCINNINICLKWDSLIESFPHYNNVEAVEILKDETSPQWWGVD